MKKEKLYILLVGAQLAGRNIEQHDIYFGIGTSIRDMVPQVKAFWPEAKKNLHLDAWREVTLVDGYNISVVEKPSPKNTTQLFFINLGGYKESVFEEFHYKMLVVAPNKAQAIQQARQTAFYKHTGFKGAKSHIDDKYGVDVDDIFAIPEILPSNLRNRYSLFIQPAKGNPPANTIHLGYFKLDAVNKWAPKENAV